MEQGTGLLKTGTQLMEYTQTKLSLKKKTVSEFVCLHLNRKWVQAESKDQTVHSLICSCPKFTLYKTILMSFALQSQQSDT